MYQKLTPIEVEQELSNFAIKPPAFETGQGYPLHSLSDRQFEILIYQIFKNEIAQRKYQGQFDDIALMTGVSEKGRDCVLYFQNKSVGVVQCKHSASPTNKLSKPDVAKEIIKFALHALQNDSLVNDPRNFSYFFVVSGDFSGPAIELLPRFNDKIVEEPDFRKWVESVIEQFVAFRGISYEKVYDELCSILQTITIERLTKNDIDSRLSQNPSLIPLFFNVRKVVETGQVEDMQKEVLHEVKALSQQLSNSFSRPVNNAPNYSIASDIQYALSGEYQAQFDFIQQLINDFLSEKALSHLGSLKVRMWDRASREEKRKLLTLMGLAQHQLGRDAEAAQNFFDALESGRDNAKSLCYAALGYLLKELRKECEEHAYKAIQIDPTLDLAYSIIVWNSRTEETFESVLAKVPQHRRESFEVATALADFAFRSELMSDAEHWYRIAIENDKDKSPEPRARLAMTLLSFLDQQEMLSAIEGFVNPYQERIAEAINLLEFAWSRVERSDIENDRANWLLNLGVSYSLAGNITKAREAFTAVRKALPDDPDVIKNCGIFAYQNDNLDEAKQLFELLLELTDEPAAKFWLALVNYESGNWMQAERWIEQLQLLNDHGVNSTDIISLQIGVYLKLKKHEKIDDLFDRLENQQLDKVELNLFRAYVAAKTGQQDSATQYLYEARANIDENTSRRLLFQTAQELYSCNMFGESAELLAVIVDLNKPSVPLNQLLTCYYNSGDLNSALSICTDIREEHGSISFVTRMEISILYRVDDLAKADALCSEYLAVYPDDVSTKLLHALINYRLHKFGDVKSFLAEHIQFQNLSVQERIQAIKLLIWDKQIKNAIEQAYELRRESFNIPEVHQFYVIDVFFNVSKEAKWLEVDSVNVDTAVTVTEAGESQSRVFIIEKREQPNFQAGELSTTDAWTKKLLNRKAGDTITLGDGPLSKSFHIDEVKSKYVHALHETMKIYQTKFPDTPGIWSMKVISDKEGGEANFQSLFDLLDHQHDSREESLELYRSKFLTIGVLAGLLGRDPIDAQITLTDKQSPGVICCKGSIEERHHALGILIAEPPIILDVTAAVTLLNLGLLDKFSETFEDLAIVRSTLDHFEYLINDYFPSSGPRMFLGKTEEGYIRGETSQEELEKRNNLLTKARDWLELSCEIIPCAAALNVSADEHLKAEALGVSFWETMLVASGTERVLFSDDLRFRHIAQQEYRVNGVWTQAILMRMREDNVITSDQYTQACLSLALLNYKMTSVNADVLMLASKHSDWEATGPLADILALLGDPSSSVQSSAVVASEYLRLLWEEQLLPARYDNLTVSVLSALTKDRSLKERKLLLRELEQQLKSMFLLVPQHLDSILWTIGTWEQLHLT